MVKRLLLITTGFLAVAVTAAAAAAPLHFGESTDGLILTAVAEISLLGAVLLLVLAGFVTLVRFVRGEGHAAWPAGPDGSSGAHTSHVLDKPDNEEPGTTEIGSRKDLFLKVGAVLGLIFMVWGVVLYTRPVSASDNPDPWSLLPICAYGAGTTDPAAVAKFNAQCDQFAVMSDEAYVNDETSSHHKNGVALIALGVIGIAVVGFQYPPAKRRSPRRSKAVEQ